MKELLFFIKNAEYNQFDWWINYTQSQLKFYLSNNKEIDNSVIFKSVLRSNLLNQLLLTITALAIFIPSLYALTRSCILIIQLPFVKELMNFSLDELDRYLNILLRILGTFFLSLLFLVIVIKWFPNILKFKEINRRIKRLIDKDLPREFDDEHLIESINEKDFNIKNPDDLDIIIIKTNLRKYNGFVIKDEESLIKLLYLAKNTSLKDEIIRLLAVAQGTAEAIEFKVGSKKEKLSIWLSLIDNDSSDNPESTVDNPFYQREFNSKSLKETINKLTKLLNKVGLSKIAIKLEEDLNNYIYTKRTEKNC